VAAHHGRVDLSLSRNCRTGRSRLPTDRRIAIAAEDIRAGRMFGAADPR
jgi:hypothetical protein